MTELHLEDPSERQCDEEPGHDRDQCQQVVDPAGARQPFEELAAIKYADAVKEHDQSDQPDRAGDVCFRRDRANEETDEEHRSDAEREAENADLSYGVAEADREEEGEDRLRADQLADEIDHVAMPQLRAFGTRFAGQPARTPPSDP